MSSKWRRFEVLLPLKRNDGRAIPDSWLGEAVREIVTRFGGVSFETQVIRGYWKRRRVTYQDELVRIVVDTPDTVKNRKWMKQFKIRWKLRTEQVEVWVVSHPIEIE